MISISELRRQEREAKEARKRKEQANSLQHGKSANVDECPNRKERQGILKFARYLYDN